MVKLFALAFYLQRALGQLEGRLQDLSLRLMSLIINLFVRVCRQLLLLAGFLAICGGTNFLVGQSLRLSDADVSLDELATELLAKKPERLGKVWKTGGRSEGLVKLTNHKRTPDYLLLEEAVHREAARYNIDADLIFALIWQESRFRLNAVSAKNARGPLQLMPGTAARFGVRNPHDAKEAVRGGVAYLVYLLDRFDNNISLALAGYNAGEGAVDSYRSGRTLRNGSKVINPRGIRTRSGIPPYAETTNYVRRIAESYRATVAARPEKGGVGKQVAK